jgi:hypothetical protein
MWVSTVRYELDFCKILTARNLLFKCLINYHIKIPRLLFGCITSHHYVLISSGRGIDRSQHTALLRDKHPCPLRDLSPLSKQANGYRLTSKTAWKQKFVVQICRKPACFTSHVAHSIFFININHLFSNLYFNFQYKWYDNRVNADAVSVLDITVVHLKHRIFHRVIPTLKGHLPWSGLWWWTFLLLC